MHGRVLFNIGRFCLNNSSAGRCHANIRQHQLVGALLRTLHNKSIIKQFIYWQMLIYSPLLATLATVARLITAYLLLIAVLNKLYTLLLHVPSYFRTTRCDRRMGTCNK